MSTDKNPSPTNSPAIHLTGSTILAPEKRAMLQKCFEAGNQKMQTGQHDYAAQMFIQCVLGDPGNIIYMQSYIGNLRIKYGNNKRGASFAFLKGGGAKSLLKTAEVRKKWLDVIKAGCECLKTNPWDESVFFAMGKAALAMDCAETGLAYLKHAVECNPDDLEVNRYAARELTERHIYDQAIVCWQRIINKKPDDLEAKRNISDLLLEQTIKKVEKAPENARAEAELAAVEERKLTPEDEFEKRLKKNPDDRTIYEKMALYFFQRGNLRKAEDTCKRGLKVFENDDVFQNQIFEIRKLRAKNDVEQTKALYEKDPSPELKERFLKERELYEQCKLDLILWKLKKNPESPSAHFEYGNYLMQHNKHRDAISEFQAARADVSIQGECLLALAFCFEQIKQYKLAMMHYDQALGVLKGTGEYVKRTLYQGARLAYQMADFRKADEYANRLAAIDFSYKDLGVLLDKISEKVNNS
ncbi:MAG: tetratricopeptide repeat protein [Planctomycetia bacterium]|nr:tetratricopeptide repeat protein [Planctomycetia bacterium]